MTSNLKMTLITLTGIVGMLFAGATLAAGDTVTLSSIQTTISSSVVNIAKILTAVSVIAGIGFIMAAFFKFHQHKLNPTQVPMSQGITLVLIGAGLTVFPFLIQPTTQAVFGVSKVASVKGGDLTKIIDGGGQ